MPSKRNPHLFRDYIRSRQNVTRKYANKAGKAKFYKSIKAPLPNSMLVKMKYSDRTITINPAVGGIGTHIMAANDMFNPDISTTFFDHQPRGFDQLMTMYDHFTVIASKITVSFTPKETAVTRHNAICGIALKDSNTPPTDANDYIESRNVSFKQLAVAAGTGNGIVTVSKTFSAKKFLGRSHPLSDSELKGNVAGGPTEKAYFHIFVEANDPALDLGSTNSFVYIEYTAVLTEPRQPTVS